MAVRGIRQPPRVYAYGRITAIRLRADHPFYKQEPSFDTDNYVLVERMTRGQVVARFSGWTHTQVCEALGIIKPDPTPLERYMEQYPGDDRDIVARVMAWKG